MDEFRDLLVKNALEVRSKAYSPYSGYSVGAAVMGENGTVYTGCNVENASYGMTVCAERVALFKMISEGCRKFTAIAVATADDGTDGVPCLACRQVMSEFRAEGEVPVYDCDPSGRVFRHTLDELAPMPFTLSAAEEDEDE